jgi:hypothetical protein
MPVRTRSDCEGAKNSDVELPATNAVTTIEAARARHEYCLRANGTAPGDPACQRVGITEVRQHHVGEARMIVAAQREVFVSIVPGIPIENFTGGIAASCGPERTAALNAHHTHPMLLL